jgi:Spy/CpxP family protein refolding chaperone
MDIFTEKKLLTRIVILLIVLNLFSIGMFLWTDYFRKPPRQPNPNEFRDVSSILKRELNLSEKQVDQLRKLRSGFFEQEKTLSEAIRSERDSINSTMFNKSTNEELVRSLARKVAENEYKIELLRFEQAQKLKSICTPEQMQKFEGLVFEIRDYFRQNNNPPKR